MADDQKAPPSETGHDPDLEDLGKRSQQDAERDMKADEALTTEEGLGEANPVGGSASAGGMADVGVAIEEVGLGKDKDGVDPQPVLLGNKLREAEEAHQGVDPDDTEDEDHEE